MSIFRIASYFVTAVFYIFLGVFSNLSLGADDFYFTKIGSSDGGFIAKTVVDGERQVSLDCAVSDSRFIQYKWSLDGELVKNTTRRHQIGANLFFTRILRHHDNGKFACIATNSSSGFSVTSKPTTLNIIWITPEASVHLSAPDKATDISPGVDVILKCKVDGTSNITFEWFRNGDPVRSERVVIRGKRLNLNSVTAEDNGAYTCKAKNDAGIADIAGKFLLTLEDEKVPKIIIPPEDQIAKNTGSVLFDCAFEQNAPFQWFFHDNGPLKNTSRYTVFANGSLLIQRVQESDEGIYKCLGNFISFPEEEPQIYSASLRISYLEELSNESLDPAPLIPGHKLALPGDSNAEIFCAKPAGLPSPRLWWEGPNGKVISTNSSLSSPRVQDSNTLIIDNVRQDVTGNYTCVAQNSEGMTRTTFQLVLSSPPTIFGHPLGTIAEEGELSFFMCQFRPDSPISQIRWLRNRVRIPISSRTNHGQMGNSGGDHHSPQIIQSFQKNGTLVINPVQLADAGDYTCEIITPGYPPVESSPAHLYVTERLKFNPKPIDRKLELGSTSKIHCKAHGAPAPVVKWVKEGTPLFQWPSHISDLNGTLYFQTVENSDKGKYTCIATNSQGLINTTIHVDVIVTPKFSVTPRNPTEAIEGHSVVIHCKAYGDPMPTIQWDKNNIMNGFDRNRFFVMENGTLLVTMVRREDDGRYGCTAGNSGGFKREEVRLIVKNDHYTESLDDANVMTRTVGITLSVAAGYMLLVIGLMLWCRYRQLKRKQAYLAEIRKENGDAEMKDTCPLSNGNGPRLIPNGHHIQAESCRESMKSDGETVKSTHSSTTGTNGKIASATASIASHKSQISQQSKRSANSGYEKISFPRQDLQFVMLLGHGDFGEVFLAKAKSEEGIESLVMVKALQTREEAALFEFKREIDMYHKLSHDNITKLVRLCREMDPHYMIMEYSDWGDLKQFLLATRKDNPRKVPKPPPLTVAQIIQVVSQVALGMEHLSNHRFVHKDLATRNCLISSGLRIQISNPNLCRDTYSTEYFKYRNQLIPIRWLPHEAVIDDDFSLKSDVWAFACLVWEVVHQATIPFANLTNDGVLESLENKQLHWDAFEMGNIPKSLQKLLSQCWDPCPTKRPSFSAIVVQLAEISRESCLDL